MLYKMGYSVVLGAEVVSATELTHDEELRLIVLQLH